MAKKVTNNTCPIFIETTFVDILIYSDSLSQTIKEPQSGVFCIPNCLTPPAYLMAQIYTKGFKCKDFKYIIIFSAGFTINMCGLSTKTKILRKK